MNATVAQQNYITCTAGPRLSLETYVEVEVQGRVAGGFPRGPQLAFDPPTLVEVSPNIVDAFVGGAIDVKGRNFGHVGAAANNVTIQVGRYACADVALLADTHARCTIASGLDTGEVVATITSWEVQSNAVAVELRCSKGYYAASDGQPCEPCPIGAECGGMLALPVALPGFFSLVRAYSPMLCSSLKWGSVCSPLRWCGTVWVLAAVQDSAFVACTPPEACQGGSSSSCLAGYTGELCGACAKQWYRIEQRCKPCPDSAWLLLIAFFVGLVAIMACGVYLQSKAMNFAGFSIGVVRVARLHRAHFSCTAHRVCGRYQDALQVYSMFVSFKFNWPTALHSVFASMSLMNFNIELVRQRLEPSCGGLLRLVVLCCVFVMPCRRLRPSVLCRGHTNRSGTSCRRCRYFAPWCMSYLGSRSKRVAGACPTAIPRWNAWPARWVRRSPGCTCSTSVRGSLAAVCVADPHNVCCMCASLQSWCATR